MKLLTVYLRVMLLLEKLFLYQTFSCTELHVGLLWTIKHTNATTLL